MISSRESLILIVHVCMYDYCAIKSGASQVDQGGACLVALAREGFVVDVVVLGGISARLGVYRGRRGGEETVNTEPTKYHKHNEAIRGARCALTR